METHALITAVVDAVNRGDIDTVAGLVHRDFLGIVPPELSAEPDTYSGPDGVRRYFELFAEAIEDLRMRVDGFDDVGDWTVAHGLFTGVGKASGLRMDLPAVLATQVREGKLYRMEAFPTLEAARSAVAERADR